MYFGVGGVPPDERRTGSAAHGMLRGLGRLARELFRAGEHGSTRSDACLLDAPEARPRGAPDRPRTGTVRPRATVLLKGARDRERAARRSCTTDRRAVRPTATPVGHRLFEQGRRMAAALLDAPHTTTVDEGERAVRAVAALAAAMEPEAT
ncbi:hypothetical protein GCM10018793_37510 [Streptomyces sulfonofaciens]|uniref:Uncharacterized protein n=1 Tax=Streptomyces sulfonofaciens TaxID=68272 RepID=A0A919GAL3_9ACTN|nr:MarR family transcriptional regulator [Streptomyces sulfonofaciens]GHH81005.1 hypothetical protein GCM10018793_37510 [Streptomyces sulfonofaciens]